MHRNVLCDKICRPTPCLLQKTDTPTFLLFLSREDSLAENGSFRACHLASFSLFPIDRDQILHWIKKISLSKKKGVVRTCLGSSNLSANLLARLSFEVSCSFSKHCRLIYFKVTNIFGPPCIYLSICHFSNITFQCERKCIKS